MAPRGVSTWRRPYTSIYNDNYRYGTGLYSDTLSDIEKRYSKSINKTQLRSDRPDLSFTTFSGSNLTSSAQTGDSNIRETTVYTRQQPLSPSPVPEIVRSPTFETRLNATLKKAAYALDEDVDEAVRARIEQRKQAIARSLAEAQTTDEEDDDFKKRLEIRKRALERAKTATEIKSQSTAESEQYVSKSKKTTSEEPAKPTSLYDDYSLWTLPKSSDKLAKTDLDTSKSKRKAGGRQTTTNGPRSSRWKDESRDLQDQVDSLEQSVSDRSTRLRSKLTSLNQQYHTELSDLSSSVEDTQQASDLQRRCKRQAGQLQELQSAYDSTRRKIQNVLEEMDDWQSKVKSFKHEMDMLREEAEMAVNKRGKA